MEEQKIVSENPVFRIVKCFDGFTSRWYYELQKKIIKTSLRGKQIERWVWFAGNILDTTIPQAWGTFISEKK